MAPLSRLTGRTAVALATATMTVAAGAAAAPAPTASPTATPPAERVQLTRIYRGDDGGALYLRELDGKVYGFGEHPGRKYAYVLTGSIDGDRITGSWWDVPKGRRAKKGALALRWSQFGTRIVRSGGDSLGPSTFTAITGGIAWPNVQAAGFQSTTPNSLNGAFIGDDGSRHYARETRSNAVWVAERGAQPGERPGWVTVFAGKRGAGGGFGGTWVDVPKGLELRDGSFGSAFVGTTRRLALAQLGAQRTTRLEPEYTLNWSAFAGAIAAALAPNVIGYAYAIADNGTIIRSGAGGYRRAPIDGTPLPFTIHTKAQTASAAKTISAAAMVKALHEHGLTVDSAVRPFLPECLKTGKDLGSLTFRQLLNHTSGLPGGKASGTATSCNGSDPYECLVRILAEGRTQPRTKDYNNKAYDLVRLLVPLVDDPTATRADFELHGCKNTGGVLHRKVAERFARYVLREVLDPVGAEGSFYPSGNFSLNYRCRVRVKACEATDPGEAPRKDFFLRSGSGKLTISAVDYVKFLSALDRGLVVPKPLVDLMKGTPGNRLGFDTTTKGTAAGGYFWKDGGCPDFEGKGRGCATLAIVFPGDTQAYVAINSKDNGYKGHLSAVLGRAYDRGLRLAAVSRAS